MLEEHWKPLMQVLGFAENVQTLLELKAAYSEPQRHYHTLGHLQDCLQKAEQLRTEIQKPELLQLALWFHDAIYNPYSGNNEQRSAEWAQRFMQQNHAPEADIQSVVSMIMATQHATSDASTDPDTALLLDIDLSILGEDANTYSQYESDIRKEYRWVPFFLYRKKRREILNAFLQRKSIYSHAFFRQRHEARAKDNLRAAIEKLH
jgi:predicted metal-dependent HD superfamily phosphohydrolase